MRRKSASNGESKQSARQAKEERESLVLWKSPVTTITYFIKELFLNILSYSSRILQYRKTLLVSILVVLASFVLTKIQGPHQIIIDELRKKLFWSAYWVGLGVLSSIGLGTGLHTFLLYLGPHIASVTLAAYECGSLNFPDPYPDSIVCPDEIDPNWTVSIWNIMRKIHLEAIMWGAGTALGELPPYFMARASRLSGQDPEEDDLKEFEELQKKKKNPKNMNTVDRLKLLVEELVNRIGFFGILVCASIPNPLFDLAGITCGHFLVPFWTFFGATLIGKAVIKMSLQAMFVIIAFSDVLISKIMQLVIKIPIFGASLQNILKNMLEMQRTKLHRDKNIPSVETSSNILAKSFECLVLVMVGYFIISIINSLAQSHHKRIHKKTNKEND